MECEQSNKTMFIGKYYSAKWHDVAEESMMQFFSMKVAVYHITQGCRLINTALNNIVFKENSIDT